VGQAALRRSLYPGVPARAGCRAVRTARAWHGILPFTHLALEGRMTVTIGRRELLAALGGAARSSYRGGSHGKHGMYQDLHQAQIYLEGDLYR